MIIVCDTDFLSSFFKIGRLSLVKNFFGEESLYIPVSVFREIAKTDMITDLLNKNWVKVKKIDDENLGAEIDDEFTNLGSGEKECIVLCKQFQDSILLISDNKARKIAMKRNIIVLNISGFLLACKETGFLNIQEIITIMQDLKEKGYYEFSDEEKQRNVYGNGKASENIVEIIGGRE